MRLTATNGLCMSETLAVCHTILFCVFSVHEIGSASREVLVRVNAMLFFLEPTFRTRDAFLPDYFSESLCVDHERQ